MRTTMANIPKVVPDRSGLAVATAGGCCGGMASRYAEMQKARTFTGLLHWGIFAREARWGIYPVGRE
jgi:hypothetical protein